MRGSTASLRFRSGVVFLLLALTAQLPAAPRTPWTTSRVIGSPNPPAPLAVERVFPGIKFENPVDFAPLPGTDRWAVADQDGRLWTFRAKADAKDRELLLDWRKLHQPASGILGFTFHPGFATNRFVFLNYNESGSGTNGAVIARFTFTSLNPPVIDPASERVIIRWRGGGHNGCTLAFGPDGYLYFSTGDGANPDPPDMPYSTGQDISDLLASVIRIDVDRTEGTNHYAVPKDNPFLTTPRARPEVWAFGFRNPFRMSFDRATGDLWVGDVGFEQWEMIYRVVRGGNYGWPITEGPNTRVRTDVKPGPGPILPPAVSIPHSEGASITGGQVYHGKKFPKLQGTYIYGDWETGKFWSLRHKAGVLIANDELCKTALKPVSFATDADGELLVLDYNGGLYRFVPNPAPPANLAFPRKLSETGVYASLTPLTPAPGVEPYAPVAPMWNDGAVARHHLAIPGDGVIAATNSRKIISGQMWFFPTNTVFTRTLTLELKKGDAASARRIETQLLHFDGQTWNPYTYRWNAAQTDAALVPAEGANDTFNVTDAAAPGGRRELAWRFHSRSECLRCHNSWSSETIGFNWLQLGVATATAASEPSETLNAPSEMRRLEERGLLEAKHLTRLVNPYDTTQPLDLRARSWLHANCAACHRNGAGGGVAVHLNADKKLAELRALDVKPTRGDFGLTDARLVAPGQPYSSALLWRIATEGAGHMPAIGSRTADEEGVKVVRDWIMQLGSPPRPQPGSPPGLNDSAKIRLTPDDHPSTALRLALGATQTEFRLHLARASANPIVRDILQRFLPPEQRRRTLALDFAPNEVLSLTGDAKRGRTVFLAETGGQCVRCHRSHGTGRDYGPDLTDIARKYDRATLLTHIMQPNLLVAPEHRTHSVLLRDDTELTGFLKQRTPTDLLLRLEDGTDRRIPAAQVASTRESALSAMPEGLLAALTAQEAADLLAFLLTP
ncbi:MAG: Soluble aldose sugar dehydrogenase YliI precursor [Verrucomicrobiota bacterium]|jgi:putative heme-binding domain-containing protein